MGATLNRRRLARTFASAGFLLLIIAITYFGVLTLAIRFSHTEAGRAASFKELGDFLSGLGAWYQDARVYGAGALGLALVSLLFGVHPLARITLPVAAAAVVLLHVYDDEIRELILLWARTH